MTTSLYLVDDHELFLSGVRTELTERFELAGWSTDVDDAIDGIRSSHPNVVLVDVHMPGGGGLVVVGNVLLTLFVLRRTVHFSQKRAAILTERRESVQAISDSVRRPK